MSTVALTLPASAQVMMTQPSGQAVLRTGTPISLRVLQGITTKDKVAQINDRVRMEVAENVLIDNMVVIPAGSPAVAELTQVRNKGMWGKSGRLVARALTVNANGRTIRLSGTFDNKGGAGAAGAIAVSALVFAPAGFFMTGKSATMPTGMVVKAFIDEDVPLSFAPTAQRTRTPMVVK